MKTYVEVPGKLIFLGEYAVLEGARALVMAVNRYVKVSVKARGNGDDFRIITNLDQAVFHFMLDNSGTFHPHPGETDQKIAEMNFAGQAVQAICKKIIANGIEVTPFSLEINTKDFFNDHSQKLGLGSSAAVIVAIVVALSRYHNIEENIFAHEGELFSFCLNIHKIAQGERGSGIDVASSVFGGIVEYIMPKINHDISANFRVYTSMPLGLFIIPVWTGISSSTRTLLQKVDIFKSENPLEYELIMEKLAKLSERGCRAFMNSDIRVFLDIVGEFYKVLLKFTQRSGIPVISEIHKNIADLVYQAGGVYKPSGAGEGDLGVAFCDSLEKVVNIKDQLQQNQIEILNLDISNSALMSTLD